ncbi:MAG: phenylalanine--tRNA ligase subunit beta [Bacteroidia bacterium]
MKVSYNWLKEIIDIQLPPEEIADMLTNCGLEVEGMEKYESVKGGLEGIVVGEVKTKIKHPNADKLSVTTVDIGNAEIKQIVCGAPNVEAGQKVLVATIGAKLYPSKGEPFQIQKTKIRGEASEGMICAEDELGLGDSHSGIMVLSPDLQTGKKASEYFSVYSDVVFEIGLTPNRGDAASHLGVARDLKAITNEELRIGNYKLPQTTNNLSNEASAKLYKQTTNISIEDHEGCLRYSGISISGVSVKESPDWLKHRLKAIGTSPINNIVDATNYVLHELGQPLHAFDADKISGNQIIVKKLSPGIKFVTLDKVERRLSGSECMICDAEKPLAMAGIFGGMESGINERTTTIFIESAYFHPVSVRKTAKHHGLNTDASFRFERGTDPNITIKALERVTQLILEIAGGEVSSEVFDVYPKKIENARIEFSLQRFKNLIGQEIPVDETKRILKALEIEILDELNNKLVLSVPPYRVDVKREADVAEEILRIYGLNKIEIPESVKSAIVFSDDEPAYKMKDKVSDYLSSIGFYELVNNSLSRSAYYEEAELKHAVKILNPLSSDLDVMRMTMLFSGLENIQHNANRKIQDMFLYEFGYTYLENEKKTEQVPHISLFLSGMKEKENWHLKQTPVTYFTIKAVLEKVLEKCGIAKVEWNFGTTNPYLSNATQIVSGKKLVAEFGTVKNEITSKFDINGSVYFADILWENLLQVQKENKFRLMPVSAFPSVRRDLALVLDKKVTYAEIKKIAWQNSSGLIREMNVFDVYEGEKIGADKKSYAISFVLQHDEKTLTDSEIDSVMNKLVKQLEQKLSASLRK